MIPINGPTRSAVHAFYTVANHAESSYQHGLYTRLVAEQLALQNREVEPSHDPVFDLIVEQEMAVLVTDDRNVPLGDLRQHLKAQLREGGQVICLIVMCFNEQQRLFRVDVPPSLRERRNGPVADISAATAKSEAVSTSHVSLLREPSA
jgi:hypothetical protein